MFASRPSQLSWTDRFMGPLLVSHNVGDLSEYQQLRENAFQSVEAVLEPSPDDAILNPHLTEGDLQDLISEAEKIFVESSDQSQLVATYCVAFWSNGTDRESIADTLTVLAQYDDPVASWYHVGPLKRRWDAATREIRTRTVQDLRQNVAFGGIS